MSKMSNSQLQLYGDTLRDLMDETDGFVDKNLFNQRIALKDLKTVKEENESESYQNFDQEERCELTLPIIIFFKVN